MKAAKNIIGYVVLDEGKPVRNVRHENPKYRYQNWDGRYPIAVFPSRKVAERVKRHLRHLFFSQANEFNPNLNADEKRCFDLWKARGESIAIRAVQSDNPTPEELRA